MFWGITIDDGKHYTQTVEESFHISMAAMEAKDPSELKDTSPYVSVMVKHEKAEFLICTLEHGKLLQQQIDLNFTEGEEVTFFIEGAGVVHLTGSLIPEDKEEAFPSLEDAEYSSGSTSDSSASLSSGSMEDEESDDEDLPTLQQLAANHVNGDLDEDEDEEESGEDEWKPGKRKRGEKKKAADDGVRLKRSKRRKVQKTEDDEDDDDGDEDEESDSDDEDYVPGQKDAEKKVEAEDDEDDDDDEDYEMEEGESEEDEEDSEEEEDDDDDDEDEDEEGEEGEEEEAGTDEKATSSEDGEKASKKKKNKKKNKKESKESGDAETKIDTSTKTKKPVKRTLKGGGVTIEELKEGGGKLAKPNKMVSVYYSGKLAKNNKQFDACLQGKPFTFRLGRGEVIKGWDIGVQGMKVGGKRKLTIAPKFGYGKQKMDVIPANSHLIFEVELKGVS